MAGAASWSFNENDFKQIQTHLQEFLRDSNARCALLVDRNGRLVATVGETPQFDPTAFASLTAADFSANDQLAKMIGEAEFASLVHAPSYEEQIFKSGFRRCYLTYRPANVPQRHAHQATHARYAMHARTFFLGDFVSIE